jgi:hypothetical protein
MRGIVTADVIGVLTERDGATRPEILALKYADVAVPSIRNV